MSGKNSQVGKLRNGLHARPARTLLLRTDMIHCCLWKKYESAFAVLPDGWDSG
ncbi:MAG: hypothetical protein LBH00_05660 [Planctomycetaceae bacterium]|nr:hypothetical protein [Planctomycetaceae bacterium]